MAVLDENGLDRLWSHIEANINSALAKYFGAKSDVGHTHSYNDLIDRPIISTEPDGSTIDGGNADTVDGKHAGDFVLKDNVDTNLSTDSTNPVQNKAVSEAISELNTLVGNNSVDYQIKEAIKNVSSGKTLTQHLVDEDMVLSSRQYGDQLPGEDGQPYTHVAGRIFFLKASE